MTTKLARRSKRRIWFDSPLRRLECYVCKDGNDRVVAVKLLTAVASPTMGPRHLRMLIVWLQARLEEMEAKP